MSILTKYDAYQRDGDIVGRLSARNSVGRLTRVYFPCAEGTGTTITSRGSSALVLDDAGASTIINYATANTMTVLHANAAPGTGTVPSPGSSSVVVWLSDNIQVAAAGSALIFGATNGARIGVSGAAGVECHDGTDSLTQATTLSPTSGQNAFKAVYLNKTTNQLYFYESANDSSLALTATVDATAIGAITCANQMTVSSTISQKIYSAGMQLISSDVTAAEMLVNLEALRAASITSDKRLPVDWTFA